jgi:hypothetical protein
MGNAGFAAAVRAIEMANLIKLPKKRCRTPPAGPAT